MKKVLFTLAIALTFVSCSKDDDGGDNCGCKPTAGDQLSYQCEGEVLEFGKDDDKIFENLNRCNEKKYCKGDDGVWSFCD